MIPASIQAWWQGLAPRERTLVAVGTLVVLLVAGYLLLWEPPAQGIRKLQGDLPLLRAQGAELKGMADEAVRLRGASGAATAIAPAERIGAVRRTLQRAGLWREGDAAIAPGAADTNSGATVSTLTVAGTVTTVASGIAARSEPPSVTAETNERVRVRFENIDYGVWVAWLAATEGELAARASRVSVVALAPKAPVGHVRAEVVLDWTQPAPPSGAPRS